jgi:hypothetical protein
MTTLLLGAWYQSVDQLVEIQKAQLDQATLMIAQQLMMRQFSIVDINGRFAAGEDNQPDQALGNDRAQDPLGLDVIN